MPSRKAVTFSGNRSRARRAGARSKIERGASRDEEAAPSRPASDLRVKREGESRARVQNLVRVRVADAAEQCGIRQRPLQRPVLAGQRGAEALQIGSRDLDAPGVHRGQAGLACHHVERCAFRFAPASVSVSEPSGNRKPPDSGRPLQGLAPAGFQCRRPAIIRCSTSQRSPSRPIAMRFPTRRNSRTTLPPGFGERRRRGSKKKRAGQPDAFERQSDHARFQRCRCRPRMSGSSGMLLQLAYP